jgi:hypothetical protein
MAENPQSNDAAEKVMIGKIMTKIRRKPAFARRLSA